MYCNRLSDSLKGFQKLKGFCYFWNSASLPVTGKLLTCYFVGIGPNIKTWLYIMVEIDQCVLTQMQTSDYMKCINANSYSTVIACFL